MGSRFSFIRLDGPSVSPGSPSVNPPSSTRSTGETRVRSHLYTQAEQIPTRRQHPSRRGSDGLTDDAAASLATFNRLMAELEASGIAADDPRLLRMLRHYRMENLERTRSVSLSQTVSNAVGSEGRRANRHRRMRTVSSTDTGDSGEIATGRQALMRQALLQLAAASSSSRQRPWPEGLFLVDGRDRRCVFCKRVVPHDDYDLHYVMCLTRPRVTYNEDKLLVDKGECSICLEDLKVGDSIARLPCLCIYHKACIDSWFQRKQTCPEHPGD